MEATFKVTWAGERELNSMLAMLVAIDVNEIRWYSLPKLYESGAVYTREARGREDFQGARHVARTKQGDCEDLAAYRTAELILAGEAASTHAYRTPAGFHIVVRRGDGTIEDPSARLGMNRNPQ